MRGRGHGGVIQKVEHHCTRLHISSRVSLNSKKIDELATKSFDTGGQDFWDWFAGKINYLGPIIKNLGLNWSSFLEDLVYLKGFGSNLYDSA